MYSMGGVADRCMRNVLNIEKKCTTDPARFGYARTKCRPRHRLRLEPSHNLVAGTIVGGGATTKARTSPPLSVFHRPVDLSLPIFGTKFWRHVLGHPSHHGCPSDRADQRGWKVKLSDSYSAFSDLVC